MTTTALTAGATHGQPEGEVRCSHHCRVCGQVFCGKCVAMVIPADLLGGPVGVIYRAWSVYAHRAAASHARAVASSLTHDRMAMLYPRREHSRFCVDLAHEYADARRVSVARLSTGLLSSGSGGVSPVHASGAALSGVARQLLTLTVSPLDLPLCAVVRWPVHTTLAQCRCGGSRMQSSRG